MLLRRRARLTSASCLYRRARADTHMHLAWAPPPLVSAFSSSKLAVSVRRAMHTTIPPPKPASVPPTASCRWKRGRPVEAPRATSMPISAPTTTQIRHVSLQTSRTEEAAGAVEPEGRRHIAGVGPRQVDDYAAGEVSLNDALQRMKLESRFQGVRFTPTAPQEAPHALDTVTSSSPPPEQYDAPAAAPAAPEASANFGRYENTTAASESDMENAQSHTDESALSDDTAMGTSSDSEYAPSLSDDAEPTKRDEEHEGEKQEEGGKKEVEEDEETVEEHIDLEYQIPEDVLRAAMQASPNTRGSFWSANMYRGPGGETLSVHYCKTMDVAERVAQHFIKEKVLGFDIEWRPYSHPSSIKGNASLVQLACENRIALFHISLFAGSTIEKLMPPTLKFILETPDILKVGVAVKGDFSRLQRYLGIEAQGVFELSRLHNLVELHAIDPDKVSNRLVGLATQVHQHLQLPLYKGGSLADDPSVTSSVRESDWSEPLDLQQIHYAAADAYAGFRLYHILEWKRKQLRPTPPTRGLCDYDSKRKPKAPGEKKKPRKRKAVAKTVTEESTAVPEQEKESEVEEAEEDEEEAYETAPEELLDSHELEDPIPAGPEPAAVAGEGERPNQRRVGRVNLPWLRGPDPGYPSLPVESDTERGAERELLDASEQLQDTDVPDEGIQRTISTAAKPALSPEISKEEDEFADPELEEVLQVMDIDDEGKLKESLPVSHEDPTPAPSADAKDDTPTPDQGHTGSGAHESTTPPALEAPPAPSNQPLHSTEYTQATDWANQYLRSTVPSPTSTTPSRLRATVPHLRAYHLWHVQQLSVDDIAAHLRDPPLSRSTVTGYILQALQYEQLDCDAEATRDLMRVMPKAMVLGRFRRMAEKVGAVGF